MNAKLYPAFGLFLTLFSSVSHAADWGYEGQSNVIPPNEWHKVSGTCGSNKMQSPINIVDTDVLESNLSVTTHYKASMAPYKNNGHGIVVNIAEVVNSRRWIELNEELNGQHHNKAYDLQQLHFHSLSEHTFSATRKLAPQHYDMELHLVHKSHDGELAVIGIPIQEGKHNQALEELFNNIGKSAKGSINMFPDVGALLPQNNNSVYIYDGSLTTPPCDEGVKWIVFAEPILLSKKQIETYRQLFSENGHPYNTNRPTQRLNSLMTNMLKWRKVYLGTVNQ